MRKKNKEKKAVSMYRLQPEIVCLGYVLNSQIKKVSKINVFTLVNYQEMMMSL